MVLRCKLGSERLTAVLIKCIVSGLVLFVGEEVT